MISKLDKGVDTNQRIIFSIIRSYKVSKCKKMESNAIQHKKIFKKLIKETQTSSLKRVLEEALNYHYSNFIQLEKIANPDYLQEGLSTEAVAISMQANNNIKFEVQAYLLQYRRLKHFLEYIQTNKGFDMPTDPELKQIWNDLMRKEGVVNILVNKWAAHRSVDDPRGENDHLHLTVLLNFESAITMWGSGHMFLSIGEHTFYLFDYHLKALKFIEWVFTSIEKQQVR